MLNICIVIRDCVEYSRRPLLKNLKNKNSTSNTKIYKKHDNTQAAKTFRKKADEGKYGHCIRKNNKRTSTEVIIYVPSFNIIFI